MSKVCNSNLPTVGGVGGIPLTEVSGVIALTNKTSAVLLVAAVGPVSDLRVEARGGLVAIGASNVNVQSGSYVGVIMYPGESPYKHPQLNLNNLYIAGSACDALFSYFV